MAEKLKVVLNTSGVRELLKSQEMMSVCENFANRAQAKLGDDYEVYSSCKRGNRAFAEVSTATVKAIVENQKTNCIVKAVGGCAQ